MTEDEREIILFMVNELGRNFFKTVDAKAKLIPKEHHGAFMMTLISHVVANSIRVVGQPPIPMLMDIGNNVLQVFKDEENSRSLH